MLLGCILLPEDTKPMSPNINSHRYRARFASVRIRFQINSYDWPHIIRHTHRTRMPDRIFMMANIKYHIYVEEHNSRYMLSFHFEKQTKDITPIRTEKEYTRNEILFNGHSWLGVEREHCDNTQCVNSYHQWQFEGDLL